MPAPLYLVPNTLDLGEAPEHQSDIRDVLPDGVLRQAAALTHWVAENAKTTRAFLKRVAAVHPLALPLQQIQIQELPRGAKGGASSADCHGPSGLAMTAASTIKTTPSSQSPHGPNPSSRDPRENPSPRDSQGKTPSSRDPQVKNPSSRDPQGKNLSSRDPQGKNLSLRGPQGRGNLPPHYALITPAQQGTPIGLISEAGLPGVADPGADIVAAAHELHIPVVVLPGPSSITLAVAASGLQGQSFAFVGYLPQDAAARAARIRALENLSRQHQQTQLMIETPYRNAALAQALVQTLSPTTRLSISCGLTLPRGWTRTQTVSQWRQQLAAQSPSGSAETPHSAPWPDKVPTVFALLANP